MSTFLLLISALLFIARVGIGAHRYHSISDQETNGTILFNTVVAHICPAIAIAMALDIHWLLAIGINLILIYTSLIKVITDAYLVRFASGESLTKDAQIVSFLSWACFVVGIALS